MLSFNADYKKVHNIKFEMFFFWIPIPRCESVGLQMYIKQMNYMHCFSLNFGLGVFAFHWVAVA